MKYKLSIFKGKVFDVHFVFCSFWNSVLKGSQFLGKIDANWSQIQYFCRYVLLWLNCQMSDASIRECIITTD